MCIRDSYLKQSKTDQYNVGEVRNQFGTGGDLCLVAAWLSYEHHFPQRIGPGAEAHLPLARYEDGSYIRRETVQARLSLAAAAFGVDRSKMGTHSLRIGGATALYHVTGDLQVVRRFGRWSSDAFHSYLWESHEQMKGLAELMEGDHSELRAPR